MTKLKEWLKERGYTFTEIDGVMSVGVNQMTDEDFKKYHAYCYQLQKIT